MLEKFRKNKQGQVFLLLALTILIYLILLSSTVYQITQSPYIEPAPNQTQLLNYLNNGISAIDELSDIAISQYSQGATRNDVLDMIDAALDDIKNYLYDHNLPANLSCETGELIIVNSSTNLNPVLIHFEAEFTMSINSLELIYDGTIYLNRTYYMEISDTAGNENYIYIYQINSGIKTMIANADVTIQPSTTVNIMGDGSYLADLAPGQTITSILPHNIILTLEV